MQFGGLRIVSLLFVDDEVLMTSLVCDLQHLVDQFTAKCNMAAMIISTSKSEAMVLSRKLVNCPLQVGNKFLSQAKEFIYLGVLFTSEGTMERETGLAESKGRALNLAVSLCSFPHLRS